MEQPQQHRFLTSKFQVGSAKSDRVNFSPSQKVFHSGDVPKEVLESKKLVQKKKQSNILGTEPQEWNQSTIANPRIQKDVRKDLKHQLLKVRAGLMDEQTVKPSKLQTDKRIAEHQKFVVAMTGQGPIGKLTGEWFNTVEERGLAKHCVEDKWPDWNESTSNQTKEDIKQAQATAAQRDERRTRSHSASNTAKLQNSTYINPERATAKKNSEVRKNKIEHQDLKEQFKRELQVEFPQASEERLQAMSQRLLDEKLLADEKINKFPVQNERFRPDLSLTTNDRRYKEYYHPGSWMWSPQEDHHCWSCCLNFGENSRGCEYRIKNPDAWCTLGFERSGASGLASTRKR